MNVLLSIAFVSTKENKEITVGLLSTDPQFQAYTEKFDKVELGMDIMAAIGKQLGKLADAEEKEQPRIITPQ